MTTYERVKPATAGPLADIFPNVNCFLDQFTQEFINVIATNIDLLTDELNVIYFAPKLWLYVIILLPRTTDNSTYFAKSLEIRGIESRLYIFSWRFYL